MIWHRLCRRWRVERRSKKISALFERTDAALRSEGADQFSHTCAKRREGADWDVIPSRERKREGGRGEGTNASRTRVKEGEGRSRDDALPGRKDVVSGLSKWDPSR